MRVLVVGGGGREHALCWKIGRSPLVEKTFCAPGNAGTSRHAECVDIPAGDFESLSAFAKNQSVDLTVVGPEQPLSEGIVDFFEKEGLRIFGPSKAAAELEGSKIFSKNLMKKYGIPTGEYSVFEDVGKAAAGLRAVEPPFVVKADGLAAGKGVVICRSREEGEAALRSMMVDGAFGEAGTRVVVEEFLEGEEASFFAFTDGENILPLEPSQDHKPLMDGDKGPNTGGMGAYTPAPVVTDVLKKRIMDEVVAPAVRAMKSEGRPYRGVLYAGLMIRDDGDMKVLEFNCRFGDPEAQPLLMRMDSDVVPVLYSVAEGTMETGPVEWKDGFCVCVVLASRGYPGSYDKGLALERLRDFRDTEETVIFHAGTRFEGNRIVTSGGRVLGVTSSGDTIERSLDRAYRAVDSISQDGLVYRKDIGAKALSRV